MDGETYLLGRQPILNRREELVAYELLFRSAGSRTAVVDDASHATASVIVNLLAGFGVEDILGGHKGFINLEQELLMDDALCILPHGQVVIELLETLRVTPELVERCRCLKENGFALALDDHEYSTAYHELYEVVDIVKVDLMKTPPERLGDMVMRFRGYPLQLLAEKVETRDAFRQCMDLGFHLFQGYYFAKPSLMKKKRPNDSHATLLHLMRLLNNEAELEEVEKAFRSNAGLTWHLLLLANSVGTGVRNKIETVRHAITLLGRRQLKRWVQLALFAADDRRDMEENPLVDMAAARAGLMERLAECHPALKSCRDAAEKAFMTGILSILEKTCDISVEEVVRRLDLSDDVREALTGRRGGLGSLLRLAELLEEFDVARVFKQLRATGISLEDLLASQQWAYTWRCGRS